MGIPSDADARRRIFEEDWGSRPPEEPRQRTERGRKPSRESAEEHLRRVDPSPPSPREVADARRSIFSEDWGCGWGIPRPGRGIVGDITLILIGIAVAALIFAAVYAALVWYGSGSAQYYQFIHDVEQEYLVVRPYTYAGHYAMFVFAQSTGSSWKARVVAAFCVGPGGRLVVVPLKVTIPFSTGALIYVKPLERYLAENWSCGVITSLGNVFWMTLGRPPMPRAAYSIVVVNTSTTTLTATPVAWGSVELVPSYAVVPYPQPVTQGISVTFSWAGHYLVVERGVYLSNASSVGAWATSIDLGTASIPGVVTAVVPPPSAAPSASIEVTATLMSVAGPYTMILARATATYVWTPPTAPIAVGALAAPSTLWPGMVATVSAWLFNGGTSTITAALSVLAGVELLGATEATLAPGSLLTITALLTARRPGHTALTILGTGAHTSVTTVAAIDVLTPLTISLPTTATVSHAFTLGIENPNTLYVTVKLLSLPPPSTTVLATAPPGTFETLLTPTTPGTYTPTAIYWVPGATTTTVLHPVTVTATASPLYASISIYASTTYGTVTGYMKIIETTTVVSRWRPTVSSFPGLVSYRCRWNWYLWTYLCTVTYVDAMYFSVHTVPWAIAGEIIASYRVLSPQFFAQTAVVPIVLSSKTIGRTPVVKTLSRPLELAVTASISAPPGFYRITTLSFGNSRVVHKWASWWDVTHYLVTVSSSRIVEKTALISVVSAIRTELTETEIPVHVLIYSYYVTTYYAVFLRKWVTWTVWCGHWSGAVFIKSTIRRVSIAITPFINNPGIEVYITSLSGYPPKYLVVLKRTIIQISPFWRYVRITTTTVAASNLSEVLSIIENATRVNSSLVSMSLRAMFLAGSRVFTSTHFTTTISASYVLNVSRTTILERYSISAPRRVVAIGTLYVININTKKYSIIVGRVRIPISYEIVVAAGYTPKPTVVTYWWGAVRTTVSVRGVVKGFVGIESVDGLVAGINGTVLPVTVIASKTVVVAVSGSGSGSVIALLSTSGTIIPSLILRATVKVVTPYWWWTQYRVTSTEPSKITIVEIVEKGAGSPTTTMSRTVIVSISWNVISTISVWVSVNVKASMTPLGYYTERDDVLEMFVTSPTVTIHVTYLVSWSPRATLTVTCTDILSVDGYRDVYEVLPWTTIWWDISFSTSYGMDSKVFVVYGTKLVWSTSYTITWFFYAALDYGVEQGWVDEYDTIQVIGKAIVDGIVGGIGRGGPAYYEYHLIYWGAPATTSTSTTTTTTTSTKTSQQSFAASVSMVLEWSRTTVTMRPGDVFTVVPSVTVVASMYANTWTDYSVWVESGGLLGGTYATWSWFTSGSLKTTLATSFTLDYVVFVGVSPVEVHVYTLTAVASVGTASASATAILTVVLIKSGYTPRAVATASGFRAWWGNGGTETATTVSRGSGVTPVATVSEWVYLNASIPVGLAIVWSGRTLANAVIAGETATLSTTVSIPLGTASTNTTMTLTLTALYSISSAWRTAGVRKLTITIVATYSKTKAVGVVASSFSAWWGNGRTSSSLVASVGAVLRLWITVTAFVELNASTSIALAVVSGGKTLARAGPASTSLMSLSTSIPITVTASSNTTIHVPLTAMHSLGAWAPYSRATLTLAITATRRVAASPTSLAFSAWWSNGETSTSIAARYGGVETITYTLSALIELNASASIELAAYSGTKTLASAGPVYTTALRISTTVPITVTLTENTTMHIVLTASYSLSGEWRPIKTMTLTLAITATRVPVASATKSLFRAWWSNGAASSSVVLGYGSRIAVLATVSAGVWLNASAMVGIEVVSGGATLTIAGPVSAESVTVSGPVELGLGAATRNTTVTIVLTALYSLSGSWRRVGVYSLTLAITATKRVVAAAISKWFSAWWSNRETSTNIVAEAGKKIVFNATLSALVKLNASARLSIAVVNGSQTLASAGPVYTTELALSTEIRVGIVARNTTIYETLTASYSLSGKWVRIGEITLTLAITGTRPRTIAAVASSTFAAYWRTEVVGPVWNRVTITVTSTSTTALFGAGLVLRPTVYAAARLNASAVMGLRIVLVSGGATVSTLTDAGPINATALAVSGTVEISTAARNTTLTLTLEALYSLSGAWHTIGVKELTIAVTTTRPRIAVVGGGVGAWWVSGGVSTSSTSTVLKGGGALYTSFSFAVWATLNASTTFTLEALWNRTTLLSKVVSGSETKVGGWFYGEIGSFTASTLLRIEVTGIAIVGASTSTLGTATITLSISVKTIGSARITNLVAYLVSGTASTTRITVIGTPNQVLRLLVSANASLIASAAPRAALTAEILESALPLARATTVASEVINVSGATRLALAGEKIVKVTAYDIVTSTTVTVKALELLSPVQSAPSTATTTLVVVVGYAYLQNLVAGIIAEAPATLSGVPGEGVGFDLRANYSVLAYAEPVPVSVVLAIAVNGTTITSTTFTKVVGGTGVVLALSGDKVTVVDVPQREGVAVLTVTGWASVVGIGATVSTTTVLTVTLVPTATAEILGVGGSKTITETGALAATFVLTPTITYIAPATPVTLTIVANGNTYTYTTIVVSGTGVTEVPITYSEYFGIALPLYDTPTIAIENSVGETLDSTTVALEAHLIAATIYNGNARPAIFSVGSYTYTEYVIVTVSNGGDVDAWFTVSVYATPGGPATATSVFISGGDIVNVTITLTHTFGVYGPGTFTVGAEVLYSTVVLDTTDYLGQYVIPASSTLKYTLIYVTNSTMILTASSSSATLSATWTALLYVPSLTVVYASPTWSISYCIYLVGETVIETAVYDTIIGWYWSNETVNSVVDSFVPIMSVSIGVFLTYTDTAKGIAPFQAVTTGTWMWSYDFGWENAMGVGLEYATIKSFSAFVTYEPGDTLYATAWMTLVASIEPGIAKAFNTSGSGEYVTYITKPTPP